MRAGHEAGLIRRRCQVHTAFEHGVEEAVERGAVAGHGLGVGVDLLVAEEQPEHAADALRGQRDAGFARSGFKAVAQHVCAALDVGVEAGRLDQFERSEEHTSELQSLMRISYAVFCLKKTKTKQSSSHV